MAEEASPQDDGSTVFVAVPVYRGEPYVAETLTSIVGQTHRDLRVCISIDADDRTSMVACARFVDDERVSLVLQDTRLGWAGNLNWLIDRCDGDYFCYWQQDDVCSADYLEKLIASMHAHPGAAATYTDVRWFGRVEREASMASLTGFAQRRILRQIDALDWIPLRGLIPADVLREVGHVGGIDGDMFYADYLYVLRLAAAGEMIRVPESLYRKRDHQQSASHARSKRHAFDARTAWLELGVAMYEAALPHFDAGDRARLAAVIIDRLLVHRADRWFGFDAMSISADEPVRFANDLLTRLDISLHPSDRSDPIAYARRVTEVATDNVDGRPALAAEVLSRRRLLTQEARRHGAVTMSTAEGGVAEDVLIDGWSAPEAWGAWSHGERASVWLPVPARSGPWRVRFVAHGFIDGQERARAPRVIARQASSVLVEARLEREVVELDFHVDGEALLDDGVIIDLGLPDATSPAELGVGEDERRLTLGLVRVELVRD